MKTSLETKFQQILPGLSHQAIDPISPCLASASALTSGGALPDNIFLHLTITGYNTLPTTNTTDTHSNSKLDSTSFLLRLNPETYNLACNGRKHRMAMSVYGVLVNTLHR